MVVTNDQRCRFQFKPLLQHFLRTHMSEVNGATEQNPEGNAFVFGIEKQTAKGLVTQMPESLAKKGCHYGWFAKALRALKLSFGFSHAQLVDRVQTSSLGGTRTAHRQKLLDGRRQRCPHTAKLL